MTRFYSKQKELTEKWTGPVCPKIRKKILKNSDFSICVLIFQLDRGFSKFNLVGLIT
jgi:hypothetical protein